METFEALMVQIGKLKNENLKLKELTIQKNIDILDERRISLLDRYALLKGVERHHYESLHKIVDVISDIHNYNKNWLNSEKKKIQKDFDKVLDSKKKLLSLQRKEDKVTNKLNKLI